MSKNREVDLKNTCNAEEENHKKTSAFQFEKLFKPVIPNESNDKTVFVEKANEINNRHLDNNLITSQCISISNPLHGINQPTLYKLTTLKID